jgi:hypothetical protein
VACRALQFLRLASRARRCAEIFGQTSVDGVAACRFVDRLMVNFIAEDQVPFAAYIERSLRCNKLSKVSSLWA